jgi:hypothetical protein
MNPGSDVVIPDGFAESTIDIDGHQVKGWVWKHDSDHQYCIIYGMNDAGELNFYRYDLQEKTLQRYFEDPVAEELKMRAEKYPEVVERYDKLVGQYNSMFILACVLGGIVIALLIFMIVVLTQKSHMPQNDTLGSMKDPKDTQHDPEQNSVSSDETIAIDRLGKKINPVSSEDSSDSELEMTRIITKDEQADYDKSQIAAGSGLDFEDLDEEDESPADNDSSDSKEDMGSTKAFDFDKEWMKSNLKDTKTIQIPSTDYSKANKTSSSDSGLDIEDL